MDPVKKGDITEDRFFKALLELHFLHRAFVKEVRKASPAVDGRGIDFLVKIRLPQGTRKRTMTVPIEVKSSLLGVRKWRMVHSDLHKAGVLIFYVPTWWWSPRKLRRLIFRALTKVRMRKDGTIYHGVFQRLFVGGSKNLHRNIAKIKRHRREKRLSGK